MERTTVEAYAEMLRLLREFVTPSSVMEGNDPKRLRQAAQDARALLATAPMSGHPLGYKRRPSPRFVSVAARPNGRDLVAVDVDGQVWELLYSGGELYGWHRLDAEALEPDGTPK